MNDPLQPRRPALLAGAVFVAAALTLVWPMFGGQFLAGSDQYVAGYSFRAFGADVFLTSGHLPLWNPYLFGGLPFVGAMHGDLFYPTAWLRWVLPTDTAMNLGFAVHLVLAGAAMYAFLRALDTGWAGAVTGGVAYQMTGIVASLVNPGHDGKLFVSALAPLLLLALLRAVRDRRPGAYGGLALTVGLALHGHPQLSYYLLVAAALWGAWLLWLAPGPRLAPARQLRVAAAAVGAVALGFGLYAVQALPFLEYIPYSPRAAGASSGGWAYATAYSLPIEELASVILPEFNGLTDGYWGQNFFKAHTEYLGVVPLILALIGAGDRKRRPLVLALGGIGLLFLLVALGGHTPFYRGWYEMMPMMKKVRAPGMAFFLVALPVAVFAGWGVDRLLRGEVRSRTVYLLAGLAAGIGALGLLGVLQPFAEGIAHPQRLDAAVANAGALRLGSARVLALGLAAAGLLGALAARKIPAQLALGGLVLLAGLDLWSVDRRFLPFQPPARVLYQGDEITETMRRTPLPFRAWDPGEVYPGSWLMAQRVPSLRGYHGNELHAFDELLGGKNVWANQGNPAIWRLYALRYVILPSPLEIPGYRQILGPVPVTPGGQGYLYEATPPPPYARVVPAAVKVPEDQIVPTVLDPRFPLAGILLYPDTVSLEPAPLATGVVNDSSTARAEVTAWAPGRIEVELQGQVPGGSYLVVAENWYPDWRGRVDGSDVPVLRADYSLLSVPLPAGARQVVFEFRSAAYQRGRLISLVSLALSLALFAGPALRRRRHG